MADKKFSDFTSDNDVKVGANIVGYIGAVNYQWTFPGAGIRDSSGNYMFTYDTAGAAAVNYLTFTSGLTTDAVTISSNGTDSNIDIHISPKAAGHIMLDQLQWPNGVATAGQFLYMSDSTTVAFTSATFPVTGTLNHLIRFDGANWVESTAATLSATDALAGLTNLNVDNINVNGNSIISTDAAGDINITPDTTGDLVLDGLKWPQADGAANTLITTDGLGQLSFTAASFPGTGTLNHLLRFDGSNWVQSNAATLDATDALDNLTSLNVDNININGNSIISTDAAGDINLTPDTTGDLILDGLKWPQADGSYSGLSLQTDSAGQGYWGYGTTKNVIVCGDFTLNPFQRGAAITGVTNGQFVADRFRYNFSGAMVIDSTYTSAAPTASEAGYYSKFALRETVTTADAAIAAGDFGTITYPLEGYSFGPLLNRNITLSFWVRSNKTGTYCVAFQSSGLDASYITEYTIDSADTWEKKTITFMLAPAAGTFDYTTGVGLYIKFVLAAGTTYQGTVDTWNYSDVFATSSQTNWFDTIGNNFYINLIQLEKGSLATPYQIYTRDEVIRFCQRYYCKTYPISVTPGTLTTQGCLQYYCHTSGVKTDGAQFRFPVNMRTTPTLTYYNTSVANANWRNGVLAADSGAAGTSTSSSTAVTVGNPQVAGDNSGNTLLVQVTANAEL